MVTRPGRDGVSGRHDASSGMTQLFVHAAQVVTCAGPPRARHGIEMSDAGVQSGVAVAVEDGRIAAVGPESVLARSYAGALLVDCARGVLTPGLVDSHTHAIFGRPRFDEQEQRAAGASYQAIAAAGGGIHSSVRDLRRRSEDELLALARPRLRRLAAYGTTTLEVKSGYGSDRRGRAEDPARHSQAGGRSADAPRADMARRARNARGVPVRRSRPP